MGLFAPLSAALGGELVKPGLFTFPQLRFEIDEARACVGAMASSGAIGPVRGPFTFVELTLADDTGLDLIVERGKSAQRLGDHLLGRIVSRGRARARIRTGHPEFDDAFWIEGRDRQSALRLFDAPLRQALLDPRLPGLEIRLQGARIAVHGEGIVASSHSLETMIDTAVELARRCRNGR
jgi:hypothetical protein